MSTEEREGPWAHLACWILGLSLSHAPRTSKELGAQGHICDGQGRGWCTRAETMPVWLSQDPQSPQRRAGPVTVLCSLSLMPRTLIVPGGDLLQGHV